MEVSQTVTIDYYLQTGTQPINAAGLFLDFDPTVLQVVSIANGSALPTVLESAYDNSDGTVSYQAGVLGQDHPSGNLWIMSVTFFATGQTPNTTIGFHSNAERTTRAILGGYDIPIAVRSSNVTINATTQTSLPPSPEIVQQIRYQAALSSCYSILGNGAESCTMFASVKSQIDATTQP